MGGGGWDKKEREINQELALELISLMVFVVFCAIKSMVGMNTIIRDSMASKKPIHQHFHPNYVPPIHNVRILSSMSMICIQNYFHIRYHFLTEITHHHWCLLRIKVSSTSLDVNLRWILMSAPPKLLRLILFSVWRSCSNSGLMPAC